MMKQRGILTATLIGLIGLGWWILAGWEHSNDRGHGMSEQTAGGSMKYEGDDARLKVEFRYPAGWRLQEERGTIEVYSEVRLLGPRNRDDTYTCTIAVRGSPAKAYGGKHETLSDVVKNFTSHLFKEANILSEKDRVVAGTRAKELTVSYTIPPLHLPSLQAMEIPVKARALFLEKEPYFYELIYSADAREYDLHADAFEQLIKTFRFR